MLAFARDAVIVTVELLLVARVGAADVEDAGFESFGTVCKLATICGLAFGLVGDFLFCFVGWNGGWVGVDDLFFTVCLGLDR